MEFAQIFLLEKSRDVYLTSIVLVAPPADDLELLALCGGCRNVPEFATNADTDDEYSIL